MSEFTVKGPFAIPVKSTRGGARRIDAEGLPDFWEDAEPSADRPGCYVFAMRAGKGFTPYYIGKATKSFAGECFTSHKVIKYNEALASYRKGRPVLFFVVHPIQKGALNKKVISKIEGFLIQLGVARNPDLLNIQNTRQDKWAIAGVVRGRRGKPSTAAQAFKKMMGIGK